MAEAKIIGDGEQPLAKPVSPQLSDADPAETKEWLDSLQYVVDSKGRERAQYLLAALQNRAVQEGVELPLQLTTPYINSIPRDRQSAYPGNREIERRIKSIVRWNAMAMVVRANKHFPSLGGHISTYASAATLYEVGYNHFFRGRGESGYDGDQIYFQGHASPGAYARAFMEGRLSEDNLDHFRRELQEVPGLSSYPHPWLMPEFWEYPTVSMGLAPIMAIYQARFNEYLADREIKDTHNQRVWAFLGDGECDEPETLGAITLAAREKLQNLIFVINCNLQRLDGPVRGNGKIIQELEGIFRGAGWNVIKVIWGDDWDHLLDMDQTGLLVKRMGEVVDGQYQKYTVMPGSYIREHFFGKYPELLELVRNYSDDRLERMRRGGHDPEKVCAAYKAAMEHQGQPTVILAKTIKGYGLGEAGEGRNVTHQQKKLNEEELREFRSRFGIPISDEDVAKAPFYRPPEDSVEMKYLAARREELGGPIPSRPTEHPRIEVPTLKDYKRTLKKITNSELWERCLVATVRARCDEQTSRLTRRLMVSHRFADYVQVLRECFFMGDGHFASEVCRYCYTKIDHGESWDDQRALESMFVAVLESHGHLPVDVQVEQKPTVPGRSDIHALDALLVCFKPPWPISIIIDDESIETCNRIMKLLLQVKRAKHALDSMFVRQVHEAGPAEPGLSRAASHDSMLFQAELMHFVNNLHYYLVNRVAYCGWPDFKAELGHAPDLDTLSRAYHRYLRDVHDQCLLSAKAKYVMDAILKILDIVLEMKARQSDERVESLRSRFRRLNLLLLQVLGTVVAQGADIEHMAHLSLSLDYNGHYSS